MSATTTHRPLRVERIDRNGWGHDDFLSGQGVSFCAVGFTYGQLGELADDEHPGLFAWDTMVEEVVAELEPQIRDLVADAIESRLPWTWEPER